MVEYLRSKLDKQIKKFGSQGTGFLSESAKEPFRNNLYKLPERL